MNHFLKMTSAVALCALMAFPAAAGAAKEFTLDDAGIAASGYAQQLGAPKSYGSEKLSEGVAMILKSVPAALEKLGVDTRVMTAVEMQRFAEPYIRNKAVSHLNKGRVVIFGCGIGSPFFSTDTAAVLRAAEINADIVLLAKNVDGVYTADPKIDPTAKKLSNIDYIDILKEGLKALDFTATSFSMENHIPILLFGLDDPENIYKAVCGEKIGTIVGGNK